MDAKQLFSIDPMAAVSYGQYNTVKKGKGSFEDFLLHYDSHEANKGKNNWLFKMISEENIKDVMNSPELMKSMNLSGLNFASKIGTSNFLKTKADGYKMQIMQEMQKRGYTKDQIKAQELIKNFKNPLIS